MQVSGRTVLVTGASSGIGRELALALAGMGCQLVVTGRDPARLNAIACATGAHALQADISSWHGVGQLADEVLRHAPQLSLVFNNAAVQRNYLLAELEPEAVMREIGEELQANLGAPMQLTALLLPAMRRQAQASGHAAAFVNISSGLALAPKKTAAVYCASKAGLRTFTKSLRFQFQAEHAVGGPDLRAMEVMLPMVDTPMTAGRGSGKIAAAKVAQDIIAGVTNDRDEIYVGKARALPTLHRVFPSLVEKMFRNA